MSINSNNRLRVEYAPETLEGKLFSKLVTGLKHDVKNIELVESDTFGYNGFTGAMSKLFDFELKDWTNLSAQVWRSEPDLLRDLVKKLDITVYYARDDNFSGFFKKTFDELRVYVSKNVDLMEGYNPQKISIPLKGNYLEDSLLNDVNSHLPQFFELSKAFYLESRMKFFGIHAIPAMSFFDEEPLVQGFDCFYKLGEILAAEKKRQALNFIKKTEGYPKPEKIYVTDYQWNAGGESWTPDYGSIKKYFEELYVE